MKLRSNLARLRRRYWALSWKPKSAIAAVVLVVLVVIATSGGSEKEVPANAAEENPTSIASGSTEPAGIATTDPAAILAMDVLGGTRQAWLEERGDATKGPQGDQFKADAPLAWYEAKFRDDGTGTMRASYVEFQTQNGKSLSLEDARARAQSLVPADATPISSYVSRVGSTVEVFHSESLAQAWVGLSESDAKSLWGDEVPGTFIRVAERGQPTSSWVNMSLGNNP